MLEALAIFFGVMMIVVGAWSVTVSWKALRRGRRERKATGRDGWRATARTLAPQDRRYLARATRRRQPINDPRLAALAVERARHILLVRESDEHQGGLRRFRRVLLASVTQMAAIGAYLITIWELRHDRVLLIAAIACFAYVPYGLIVIGIFPPMFRREAVALRRTVELNRRPPG